ncbi:MAG: DNA-binding protein, partial [Polaromonas sp.]
METLPPAEQRLQAEIEALRTQFPETQELYREVCILLFFRHGITPTTNKLYQLVRKGSMSAPAEALNRFWETLREKSRIRIEHPDLPQPLRDAAGELVSALWQQAQAAAKEGLSMLRREAQAEVIAARTEAQAAQGAAVAAQDALASVQRELHARDEQLRGVQAELARAQGEASALQRQVDTGAEQRRELQDSLKATQQRFTAELEQQRAAAATAQQ